MPRGMSFLRQYLTLQILLLLVWRLLMEQTGNPFTTKGIVSNRHSLITRQGYGPQYGESTKFLPSGETKVVV